MKRLIAAALLFCTVSARVGAQGDEVIASTPWVGAIARAAGAQTVRVLAPSGLQDPLAYALSEADLGALQDANWVIYTGAEAFANELAEAPRGSAQLVRIDGSAAPENVLQQAARLADLFGSVQAYQEWAADYVGISSRIKAATNSGYPAGTRVIVHPDLGAIAEWLGFEVLGEIGPEGVLADKLESMLARLPEVVLDSYHDPAGSAAAEAGKALYVKMLIHPGPEGTETLEDVLRHNQGLLVSFALPEGEEPSSTRWLPWLAGGAVGLLLLIALAFFGLRRLAKS